VAERDADQPRLKIQITGDHPQPDLLRDRKSRVGSLSAPDSDPAPSKVSGPPVDLWLARGEYSLIDEVYVGKGAVVTAG